MSDEIEVRFKTRREMLMRLAGFSTRDTCPGRISLDESYACPDSAKSDAEGDCGYSCRKCWLGFIDRITVDGDDGADLTQERVADLEKQVRLLWQENLNHLKSHLKDAPQMSKIKVSFRDKLIRLISESDSCPGDLVEGETSECETGINCDECVEAFIDRITVEEKP
jgi:hypothetical protein